SWRRPLLSARRRARGREGGARAGADATVARHLAEPRLVLVGDQADHQNFSILDLLEREKPPRTTPSRTSPQRVFTMLTSYLERGELAPPRDWDVSPGPSRPEAKALAAPGPSGRTSALALTSIA